MTRQFALAPVRSFRPSLGFAVSILVHAGLAAPLVLPRSAPAESEDRIDRLVVFLVPPDVEGGDASAGRGVEWAGAIGDGGAVEEEEPPPPEPEPEPETPTPPEGQAGDPEPVEPEPAASPKPIETALTEIEVDSMVERDPTSASPEYPTDMLAKNIQGSTFVHYVVDTTGRVDTSTIRVITTTHEAFAASVRRALGLMKFRPAIQGSRKVRQWVEQNFAFKIVPRATPADTT